MSDETTVPTDPPTTPKQKLRWYQFSLRTLLIFVTLCALPCSWFAVKMKQAEKQRESVEALAKLGAAIKYDYQFDGGCQFKQEAIPPGPSWLRKLLGDDFFITVKEVDFSRINITDADLKPLRELSHVKTIWLTNRKITDAGIEHLRELRELEVLDLSNTQVTDTGVEHLKESSLYALNLPGTKITDVALKHLKKQKRLFNLALMNTAISDSGLDQLKELNNLRFLHVNETKVTDAGIAKLKKALPNCKIRH